MAASPFRIRVARTEDVETACQILTEATNWEESMGFPAPWPRPFPREALLPSCARGELYLVESETSLPIGTITLQWVDVPFWGERPPDAGYVHRLAIRSAARGRGVGKRMVLWAAERTKEFGRSKLRLDCLTASARLHAYYHSLGFVRVGEVIQGGLACTLFEKSLD